MKESQKQWPSNGAKKHGGQRKGAGRTVGSFVNTQKKEATFTMRIPVSKIDAVKKLIGK